MVISKKVSWLYFNDKVYVKNLYSQKLLCLTDIGKEIWESLERRMTMDQLILGFLEKYKDEDSRMIEDDINGFLLNLKSKGYLE